MPLSRELLELDVRLLLEHARVTLENMEGSTGIEERIMMQGVINELYLLSLRFSTEYVILGRSRG
jgi:hypothetical protein